MRRLGTVPALLLTALLLTSCGDESEPVASDPQPEAATSTEPAAEPTTEPPAPEPTSTDPTKSPPITPGGVPFEVVEVVSGTAGKGELSPEAVPLGTDTEVARFVAQLSPELAADVRAAVDASTAPAGQLYGAVVGLGCDVPPGVAVTRTSTGFDITGLKVADPLQECFAAVTSVAVVAIAG